MAALVSPWAINPRISSFALGQRGRTDPAVSPRRGSSRASISGEMTASPRPPRHGPRRSPRPGSGLGQEAGDTGLDGGHHEDAPAALAVSTMIAIDGRSSRSRPMAATPSPSGSRWSSNRTSGAVVRISATALSRLPATPTDAGRARCPVSSPGCWPGLRGRPRSAPGSCSSDPRCPLTGPVAGLDLVQNILVRAWRLPPRSALRSSGASSPRSRRASASPPRTGPACRLPWPAPRRGLPRRWPHVRAHAGETQVTWPFAEPIWSEAPAVVGHLDLDAAVPLPHRDDHLGGGRVLAGVDHRLVHDPVGDHPGSVGRSTPGSSRRATALPPSAKTKVAASDRADGRSVSLGGDSRSNNRWRSRSVAFATVVRTSCGREQVLRSRLDPPSAAGAAG